MDFATNVLKFFSQLEIEEKLPKGVEVLNPYKSGLAMKLSTKFYQKYYPDNEKRTFLIGINPGRLGSGLTGIGFTDPVNLADYCGIESSLDKKHELSSRFIYQMINSLGGVNQFYRKFYFTSVSPLGFVKDGKNLNYYDIPELQVKLEKFIVSSMKKQIEFGAHTTAYSLGMGKNIAYLNQLNKKHCLFETIVPLPHPRWIMQYRLRRLEEFIELYSGHLSPFMEKA